MIFTDAEFNKTYEVINTFNLKQKIIIKCGITNNYYLKINSYLIQWIISQSCARFIQSLAYD